MNQSTWDPAPVRRRIAERLVPQTDPDACGGRRSDGLNGFVATGAEFATAHLRAVPRRNDGLPGSPP
ncbi:hypothetical protein [Streptomyces sp. NEAU-YJ-81]|uniref:hypothetical protein n=1 Tax=Streptomyces sp. NEAU-YJ-81 TaxID=2820288 RepID=UPI002443B461|nr:hypothetical protein [Streptomyces sp. NEAU-YJ-81]